MAGIYDEQLFDIKARSKIGAGVSVRTLKRYIKDGYRVILPDGEEKRVRLEHVREGWMIRTSREAYRRFLQELTRLRSGGLSLA